MEIRKLEEGIIQKEMKIDISPYNHVEEVIMIKGISWYACMYREGGDLKIGIN